MSKDRMDPRVVEKISGPAWQPMNPLFLQVSEVLLNVSATSVAELTTIYVKFSTLDTCGQPYAVVWLRKATELVIGLALQEDAESALFQGPPKGCKYAGLTKYVLLNQQSSVPEGLEGWAQTASSLTATRVGK
jgi:hypothetical protein